MEVNSFSIFPTAARGHVILWVVSQPLCFRKQSINSRPHTADRPLNPSPQIMASGGRRPADLLLVAYQLQHSPLRWSANTHTAYTPKQTCIKHTQMQYTHNPVASVGEKNWETMFKIANYGILAKESTIRILCTICISKWCTIFENNCIQIHNPTMQRARQDLPYCKNAFSKL